MKKSQASKKSFFKVAYSRFLRFFRDMEQTPPLYKRRNLLKKGDWIDDFGIYHQPRNWTKMTKHCGGWNNNNGS